jgi:endonuclease-3
MGYARIGNMAAIAKLMNKQSVEAVFATFAKAEPHPVTELKAPNPYCLLVSIVLSAQATDVSVNKATPALFAKADTPEKMVKLGEAGIKNHIRTIGLFNAKARNVLALSKKLVAEFGGQVPHRQEELETLPGVGRKTANVWRNCVLGDKTIAVDTHVFRVANRMGLCDEKTPVGVELALMKKIPDKYLLHAHHWLILHGRYTCKARLPECPKCIVREWCGYKAKTV